MKTPQPLPEGLATMAPGPELAVALDSICPFSVSGNATVEVFRARLRQRNAEDAAVHRWAIEVVLRRPGSGQTVERLQIPYEYGVDEIAAAGGMSTTAATKLLELAWSTVMRLPQLHEAMACGGLDEKAAWALSEWTAELSEEHAHSVVDELLPRAVLGLLDGTYEGLSDEQILKALAATVPTQDDETKPEPAPAPAPRSPQEGVQLSIRLTTLLGLDRAPAELPGWGPIPNRYARDLTAAMGAAQWRFVLADDDGHYLASGLVTSRPVGFDKRDAHNRGVVDLLVPASLLQDVVVNPAEGAHLIDPDLLAQWMTVLQELTESMRRPKPMPDDSNRRFPGAALRRSVQLRKPRCVGVGCGRASLASELDHRLDWAYGGRTEDRNLDPECGRHHTVKTKGGWTVHRYQRHGYRWCTALGREYVTTLPRVIGLLPAPAGPDFWWEAPDPDENPDVDANGNRWQESEIWFPHTPEPDPPPQPEPPPEPPPRPVDLEKPPF